MPKYKSEVSRIYLSNKSAHGKRLLNIVAIKSAGKLFEYKITFDGLNLNKEWTFVEAAVLDAVNGLRSSKRQREVGGQLSVGYHQDGNVMYKLGDGNFKPVKHTPFSRLSRPVLFLRISGFALEDLNYAGLRMKENSTTISLANYSTKTNIVCDLYISRGPTNLNFVIKDKNVFKNSEYYSVHDEEERISMHFHFYRAAQKGVFVAIVKKGLSARVQRFFLYYYFRFVSKRKTK